MKILISAYSCEPNQGSERGVGWNIPFEISKYHEVWVLTRPDESKEAIEAELAHLGNHKLHFVYFTLPVWSSGWKWGNSGFIQLHYYLWQIQAYFVAKRLHHKISFDLVHHVTFVKYSTPCFLCLLNVPLIWGPVGGGEMAPFSFWQQFSLKAKLYESMRYLARIIGELDPFVRLTARKSSVVRATTKDTAERLILMGADTPQLCPESGLSKSDLHKIEALEAFQDESKFRIISIGRLLHWKGFNLSIRAFADANIQNSEYLILGEGPELEKLKSLALSLGVQNQVKFLGFLPREDVLEKLSSSHVLVHPSLHDSGGWVCLESMAAKRPVICLDLGGPGVQVVDQVTGIKVKAISPEQTISDLAKAMQDLASNPEKRKKMGLSGKDRIINEYTWEGLGKRLSFLYQEINSS